jgi:hypothetical protein
MKLDTRSEIIQNLNVALEEIIFKSSGGYYKIVVFFKEKNWPNFW